MIISILLSIGLLGVALYVLLQDSASRLVRVGTGGVVAVGLYFVWWPDQASRVANAVGVGRGADLVMYCWIVVSLILIVNTHLKLRQINRDMTALARGIALRSVRQPKPPVPVAAPGDSR